MKRLLCALASLIVLGTLTVNLGFAEDNVTEAVSTNANYYVERGIKPIKKSQDHALSPICSFDANADGKVAVCFGEDGKRTVLVFDEASEVLYGYSVALSGEIVPRWTDKGLALYLASSRIAVALDENGGFVEKARYRETEEGEEAVRKLFYDGVVERVLEDGTVYRLSGGSETSEGGVVYDRLVRLSADGEERVVYEAAIKPEWGERIAVIGGCVAFLGLIGVVLAEVCLRVNTCAPKDTDR